MINLCVLGCPPAPVYKGGRGRCGRPPWGAPGGVLLPPGAGLPPLALVEKERGAPPPSPCLIRTRGRRRAAHLGCPSLSLLRPIWPITSPGGVSVTLRLSGFLRNHPEHFRCPNIAVQYINLYVSTISRLLVMSVITSGTPNKLRYIKTYKLIIKLSS